jgi:hypothetical protein
MYHTSDRPLLIEMIRSEAREYSDRALKAGKFGQIPEVDPGKHLFKIFTANQWMDLEKNTPVPKMLFGELWYEGELCILFADTNAGKSVLAVQIGNSLARREPIGPFTIEAEQANVVYIDFELSGKQFYARYTHNEVTFQFGKGFYRAGFNSDSSLPPDFKTYDDYMNNAIEFAVKNTGADVLIIDNITCLRSGTERAADALPLMKHLKALKTKYQLSILALAHTPKRNHAKPLSVNDLQGSKMLINFADSAFAIGESYKEKGLRYLKQIKQRNTQQVYGDDNVCLFNITKPENFLHFKFEGNGRERDHLCSHAEQQRKSLTGEVAELAAKGYSQRNISDELGIGLGTVNRIMKIINE